MCLVSRERRRGALRQARTGEGDAGAGGRGGASGISMGDGGREAWRGRRRPRCGTDNAPASPGNVSSLEKALETQAHDAHKGAGRRGEGVGGHGGLWPPHRTQRARAGPWPRPKGLCPLLEQSPAPQAPGRDGGSGVQQRRVQGFWGAAGARPATEPCGLRAGRSSATWPCRGPRESPACCF